MTSITILGLGEAGQRYATDLRAAGADVVGHDPFADRRADGLAQNDDLGAAVARADVVISLVGGAAAVAVAAAALPSLAPSAVYADFNTAAPETKEAVAALAARVGVPLADVAVLAPVYRAGHRTELLASGDGADRLAAALSPLGVPIVAIDGGAGAAARLRLLRSVFMKGLAALVIEGLAPARAAGAEDWLRTQIAAELGPDGAELVDRLIEGTYRHAVRREREVGDALAALEDGGHPADMTRATRAWLQRIIAERDTDAAEDG